MQTRQAAFCLPGAEMKDKFLPCPVPPFIRFLLSYLYFLEGTASSEAELVPVLRDRF